MKTTRYRFEKAVESARSQSVDNLKQEYRDILESDKDFTQKSDYIGYSLLSIDSKVNAIDEQIKELQELKANMKEAKLVALETGAEVFGEYGIDKIEGGGISSITISKESIKSKKKLLILNEEALIKLGHFKVSLDEQSVMQEFDTNPDLRHHCQLIEHEIKTPAKLKVNKRRGASKSAIDDKEVA